VNSRYSDSLFRWMWIAFLLAHKLLRPPIFTTSRLFWRWWYQQAYGEHGMYALMYLAKANGYPWAQPFGEGEEGVRKYLGGRWNRDPYTSHIQRLFS